MTTFLTAAERTALIAEYMDCWLETESWAENKELEAQALQAELEAMNNSELVKEIRSTGWGIL